MKSIKPLLCITAAAQISACATASEPPVVLGAETVTVGTIPDDVIISRNPDGSYTIGDGTDARTTTAGLAYTSPQGIRQVYAINGMDSEGPAYYITRFFYAKTPGGEGEVTYIFSPPVAYNGFDFSAAELTRNGTTTVPAGGTITMTGSTALHVTIYDGLFDNTPAGRAELTANFDDGTISGRTYDIQFFDGGGDLNQYAVTFQLTDIDDGSFSGVASPVDPAGLSGTYSGLIVGASGDQAIGSYTFTRNVGYTETIDGIFVVGGTPTP